MPWVEGDPVRRLEGLGYEVRVPRDAMQRGEVVIPSEHGARFVKTRTMVGVSDDDLRAFLGQPWRPSDVTTKRTRRSSE